MSFLERPFRGLFRRVLEFDPTHLATYSALGRLYRRQGRLDEAREEYDALTERSPDPVAAVTMAGVILLTQGRTDQARERFERAVGLDPDAAVAANNLAWIYAETDGNLDVALGLAQRATAQLPDLPQTNDTLGWVHYKKGLASLAIPFFEKSIAKDVENPVYHYHLGLAYAKADDRVRARQALERALGLQPDFEGADEARRLLSGLRAGASG